MNIVKNSNKIFTFYYFYILLFTFYYLHFIIIIILLLFTFYYLHFITIYKTIQMLYPQELGS